MTVIQIIVNQFCLHQYLHCPKPKQPLRLFRYENLYTLYKLRTKSYLFWISRRKYIHSQFRFDKAFTSVNKDELRMKITRVKRLRWTSELWDTTAQGTCLEYNSTVCWRETAKIFVKSSFKNFPWIHSALLVKNWTWNPTVKFQCSHFTAIEVVEAGDFGSKFLCLVFFMLEKHSWFISQHLCH